MMCLNTYDAFLTTADPKIILTQSYPKLRSGGSISSVDTFFLSASTMDSLIGS